MDNFDKYVELTKAHDWDAIFKLNGVDIDNFGTKKELAVLPSYLEKDEVVFALASGVMAQSKTSNALDFGTNTWLVILTSDRFLFLDHAMLSKSVDTQSIRHKMVSAVSSSQGLMLGKISIDLGSRVLEIDNCKKQTVAVVADLANKWLKELDENDSPINKNGFDKLEKLTTLHSLEVFTDSEFKEAKLKILASDDFKIEKEKFLSTIK